MDHVTKDQVDNCPQAAQYGVYNIPEGSPGYGRHLDRPYDGLACENPDVAYNPALVPDDGVPTSQPTVPAAYANCTAARADGAVNIPVGDPRYGAHLDRDGDGIGCEQSGDDDDPVPPTTVPGNPYDQMDQVPVGGADTGVAVEQSTGVGGLALGGGLALATAAGAAYAVRRRTADRA